MSLNRKCYTFTQYHLHVDYGLNFQAEDADALDKKLTFELSSSIGNNSEGKDGRIFIQKVNLI